MANLKEDTLQKPYLTYHMNYRICSLPLREDPKREGTTSTRKETKTSPTTSRARKINNRITLNSNSSLCETRVYVEKYAQ